MLTEITTLKILPIVTYNQVHRLHALTHPRSPCEDDCYMQEKTWENCSQYETITPDMLTSPEYSLEDRVEYLVGYDEYRIGRLVQISVEWEQPCMEESNDD